MPTLTEDVHTIEQDKTENIFYEGNNLITRTKPIERDEAYYED